MKKPTLVKSILTLIGIIVFLLGFGFNQDIEFKEGSLIMNPSRAILMANTTETDLNVVDQWAITYGGGDYDWIISMQQPSDGGYIMAGATVSFGAGSIDSWVLRLNADGTVAWQKTYGGSEREEANSIHQTSDGGYIIAGYTRSFGAGSYDGWVLKLGVDGSIAWQKSYGQINVDWINSIQQTADGGYIMAGYTYSFGAGECDVWVVKLKADGNIAWQRTYGGSARDAVISIQQTADGGYIMAGGTSSFGAGDADVWVLKLNADGSVAWQKAYGGTDEDRSWSIQQTADGGYIVAGWTASFGAGHGDGWVLKLNADGGIAWQKTYGGTDFDWARSIQQTADGGYITPGYTVSFGAGAEDSWVLKLNTDGSIAWQRTYGGSGGDWVIPIQQTADGGYIMAGYTDSFGAGSYDGWVLKLNSNGEIPGCIAMGTSDATVSDTSVVGQDTRAIVENSLATISDTNVSPLDSWPQTSMICYATLQDAIRETLQESIDTINSLDDSVFKNRNIRKALINKINAVLEKVDQGFYQEALNKLEHDILAKTDGCAETGSPDKNDWIMDCESQNQVYPLITEAMELLRRLIRARKTEGAFGEHFEPPREGEVSVETYPNPYNLSSGKPLTFWGTGVPQATIKIYTLSGELVKTLKETQGEDKITWDGRNEDGQRIVRGIYFFTTKNPRERNTGKFTVVR